MRRVRYAKILGLLFLLSEIVCLSATPRQSAAPSSGGTSDAGGDAAAAPPPGQDQRPQPARKAQQDTDVEKVFSRGIIPPSGWNQADDDPTTEVNAPVLKNPPDGTSPKTLVAPFAGQNTAESPTPVVFGDDEEEIARHAWRYFLASREPSTGLYDSVLHYHATTMWDAASGIAALVASQRLGLLTSSSFQLQMRQLLTSLATMPLYHDELPNREYSTHVLVMLDHHSAPSEIGSGWSALDIGRMLIWLRIVAEWYPDMLPMCQRVVSRWKFGRLSLNGEANGAIVENGKEYIRQEGRLGYEQYAAKGFALWGIDLPKASGYSHAQSVKVLDVDLRRDDRDLSFLTSEPFFLTEMEVGSLDSTFDELTSSIFKVQRSRWQQTGVLTATSEDSTNLEPWFVYNTILYNADSWACVSTSGKPYPALRSLSTKAAIADAALTNDSYGMDLQHAAISLSHPLYGYYAGEYEQGGVNRSLNINTNAVILEAMLYRKLARRAFLQVASEPTAGKPGESIH